MITTYSTGHDQRDSQRVFRRTRFIHVLHDFIPVHKNPSIKTRPKARRRARRTARRKVRPKSRCKLRRKVRRKSRFKSRSISRTKSCRKARSKTRQQISQSLPSLWYDSVREVKMFLCCTDNIYLGENCC